MQIGQVGLHYGDGLMKSAVSNMFVDVTIWLALPSITPFQMKTWKVKNKNVSILIGE